MLIRTNEDELVMQMISSFDYEVLIFSFIFKYKQIYGCNEGKEDMTVVRA